MVCTAQKENGWAEMPCSSTSKTPILVVCGQEEGAERERERARARAKARRERWGGEGPVGSWGTSCAQTSQQGLARSGSYMQHASGQTVPAEQLGCEQAHQETQASSTAVVHVGVAVLHYKKSRWTTSNYEYCKSRQATCNCEYDSTLRSKKVWVLPCLNPRKDCQT
eukprot:4107064-Pleurochrysis_carterae.AAC.1